MNPEENEERVPVAVCSGEIMGLKVHVLDDGSRIIDAADLEILVEKLGDSDFDMPAFARAYRRFVEGETPDQKKAEEG